MALIAMAVTLAGLRLARLFVPALHFLSFSLRVLSSPPALIALSLVCGLLLLLLAKREKPIPGQRIYLLVSLGLLAIGAVVIVLCNTVFAARSFGWLDRFVKLNENWGTDRGRIWAYCLNAFRSFSPLEMIFGKGPGFLALYDSQHPIFPDAILDTAHNEYIQYLLTIGIAGLLGYLALLIGTVRAAYQHAKESPLALALIVGIVAYAAQAFVNIAQPASTPILFLLLGMAAGSFNQKNGHAAFLE
jgi:O-antigen ligase